MNYEEYKQKRLSGITPEEAYEQDASGFSASKMIGNVPKSAGQFVGGAANAVIHPIQTVKTLGSVAAGGVEKLIPGEQAEEKYFDNLTDFYKDRYGSFDKFLTALEDDPVGIASDASLFLTGGGALATKLGGVSKASSLVRAGQTASRVGQAINPINAVTGLTGATKALFPKLAQKIEKSNLRLTRTKEGAMATQGLGFSDDAINITKNRLNEVTDYLAKQKIVGNPLDRFAKATNIYYKTEDALDNFFSSFSKGSVVKQDKVIRSLQGLKSIYKGERDYNAITKQIDGAIKAIKSASKNDALTYKTLNQFKRSTYKNAYNKAGEKVVDGVEHAIGDTIRGIIDEDLRGLKIAGQSYEQFNHNYGLLIEARKLLKTAVGKPEMSVVTERVLGGLLGYLIGGSAGFGSGGAGALLGTALGPNFFQSLPVTTTKSLLGAGAQKIGETKLPSILGKTKTPLTAIERIKEAQ